MKQLLEDPTDAVALLALAVLAIGVGYIAGIGWSLVVISTLVLIYLVLPDRRPGGPT